MLRWTIAIFLLIGAAAAPVGAQIDRRAVVESATADAVNRLYAQIASEVLAQGVTVKQLIDATDGQEVNGREILWTTLQRAEQIGGPRWIDEGACQVKLSIGGAPVASALSKIAVSDPYHSPVDAGALQWALRDWNQKTFTATGSSNGLAPPAETRTTAPPPWPTDPGTAPAPPPWPGDSGDQPATAPSSGPSTRPQPAALIIPRPPDWVDRQIAQTAMAADAGSKLRTARVAERDGRADLLRRVLDLPLVDGRTLGQEAENRPGMLDAIQRGVDRARVYKTDYHADGVVEVKLSLELRDVWDALVTGR